MIKKIKEILKEIGCDAVEDENMDLIANGIIDSFDIVNICVEIEEYLDIEIDVEEITPDNFRTISSISKLMEQLKEN